MSFGSSDNRSLEEYVAFRDVGNPQTLYLRNAQPREVVALGSMFSTAMGVNSGVASVGGAVEENNNYCSASSAYSGRLCED